jgi:RimJ/RimL family protein N-acetyltransferase
MNSGKNDTTKADAAVSQPAVGHAKRENSLDLSSIGSLIRELNPGHQERIAKHLLALSDADRYLRFGYMASDEQIQRYVDGLNFERDAIFGIFDDGLQLLAVAHLAYSVDRSLDACGEFGVSVLKKARGRGYGTKLFERAVRHARNVGVHLFFIHALSENTAMLKIARKGGATVVKDGTESEAYLQLPPATFDSMVSELLEEQIAKPDYRLKLQAKKFWSFLRTVQEIRRGVQEGRHKSSS